jgi:tetratricopeptide (TPR) repeat protein
VSTPIGDLPRRVIPRWRDFRTTAALGELGALVDSPQEPLLPTGFDDLLEIWRGHKTDSIAAELLGASWLQDAPLVAAETAKYILRGGSTAHPFSREIAQHILEEQSNPTGADTLQIQNNPDRTLIRALRDSLRNFPYNGIGWCELARYYLSIGKDKSAKRAMMTALHLAPNDRYVLRSAARCFIHLNEPELALRLVTEAPRTQTDPWLLAAHVSISSLVEKSPRFFRRAREMGRDESVPPFHNSELVASLGTLEVFSGNDKKARKLLGISLADPTENVVAQAWWARSRVNINPPARLLDVPRSFEANMRALIQTEQWETAVDAGGEWLKDEPFSRRPAIETSFVLTAAFADYEAALRILKRSFPANSTDPLFLNNLAFTYASLGRTKEARETISKASGADAQTATVISLTATEGLIQFRESAIIEGRQKYQEAMEMARVHGLERQRALAAIYLAMQEKFAHTPEAPTAAARATELASKFDDPVCRLLIDVLNNGPKKMSSADL